LVIVSVRRVAALVLLFALTASGGEAASGRTGGSWVTLSGGGSDEFSWVVKARRGESPGDPNRLCLRTGVTVRHGRFGLGRSRSEKCTARGRRLGRRRPPLVAGLYLFGAGADAGMTVIGIAVAPGVDRVTMTLSSGRRVAARTVGVGADAEAALGPPRLRHLVVALREPACAESLATEDARGGVLWTGAVSVGAC
jgi:hypothetical protein